MIDQMVPFAITLNDLKPRFLGHATIDVEYLWNDTK